MIMMIFLDYWKFFVLVISIFVPKAYSQLPRDEKPGVCPQFNTPTSDLCVIECNQDKECPGNNKCCSLISCGSICTSPLIPTPTPKQEKVKPTVPAESENCKNECDNSRQCGSLSLCIRQGCRRVCKSFSTKKPEERPTPKPKAQLSSPFHTTRTLRNCTDECLRNAHCKPGYICINKGCRNVCEVPISESNVKGTSIQNVPFEDCTDKCLRDSHCPLGYICIKQGCRYICFENDQSKNSRNTPIIPNRIPNVKHRSECDKLCVRDTDCSQGSICVQQGCNTFCKRHRQQITINTVPALRMNGDFSKNDCIDECTFDVDCGARMHCRRQGCRRVCKHAIQNLKSNSTRSMTKSLFETNCQNECNVDMDCSFGFICRQIGCRRACQKEITGHSIDKNFKTASFLNCQDQCSRDSDCQHGELCVQIGCKKECGQKRDRSISTTSQPFSCNDECLIDRDCDLGNICIVKGCKRICQKYEHRKVHRSREVICEIECTKDADCLVGQSCVQDGCNKLCITKQDMPLQSATESCSHQCLRDSDCSQNLVCRRIGCRNVCYSFKQNIPTTRQHFQSNSQTDSRFQSGLSTNTQRRAPICKIECTNNAHCPLHSTCIQIGCDRTCENQQLGSFN